MIHTVSESSQVNEVSLDNNADDNKDDGDQIIDNAEEKKLPTNVNDTTLGPGWTENQKKTSINNVTTDQ